MLNPRLPIWAGQDIFIIGGGPSLREFDWSLLAGRNTIGCNNAFQLGETVCGVCIFGDYKFWLRMESELAKFKNAVVTNCPRLSCECPNWLIHMPRVRVGLPRNKLGWYGNTGASAINLALILGARRIFLLGFDAKIENQKTNWHDNPVTPMKQESVPVFLEGFSTLANDWKRDWPHVDIWNLNPNTAITAFPVLDFRVAWKELICENQ